MSDKQRTGWVATTESGAQWRYDRGTIRVTGGSSGIGDSIIRKYVFRVSVEEHPPHTPFSDPGGWEDAETPVVGRRMYVADRNEWRISSRVVSWRYVED